MPSSIELFTGVGGLALGVAQAGFQHLALAEYNRHACCSLRKNEVHLHHGKCQLFEGDVRAVNFSQFEGKVDLLAAGAPCQPFSIGGRHRAHQDHRNLFPEVFRVVRETRPKAVVVENVKGLLRPALDKYVEYIELQLALPDVLPADPSDPEAWREHLPVLRREAKASSKPRDPATVYRVRHRLLNAADFGVPQRRERVFFVAIRADIGPAWTPPTPTHTRDALLYDQWVSGDYWREHDLPVRRTPISMRKLVRKLAGELRPLMGDRWQTVRDALVGLPEPRANEEPEGWLNHILQPGARAYPGHTGSPLDLPAKTLKAGVHGVPGGENTLRRTNGTVRYFTVREAARLQGMPDRYLIEGAWGEAMRQLGNAVPAPLAREVASSVALRLDGGRDLEAPATSVEPLVSHL